MATGRLPDPNTAPLTAKGDLYTYSTTPARLAVGSNGDTLVADSAATTGLRWQGNFAAGKNKIINGDFSINQRNFTSTTSAEVYGLDRWKISSYDGTTTYSVQQFTTGTAPVAGYEAKQFARVVTTGQTSSLANSALVQPIEDVRTFTGQTITVSFWAKAASGTPKVAIELVQYFGTGGSPSSIVYIYGGQATLSTSWSRYSVVVNVPSINGKTIGTNSDSYLALALWLSSGANWNSRTGSLGIQTNTFDIWGVQVEAGSVATAFQTATGTLQGELAACQRYYYRHTPGTTFGHHGVGYGQSSTTAGVIVNNAVSMRTAPSSIDFSGLGLNDGVNATIAVTGLALTYAGIDKQLVTATTASGVTQYRPYSLMNNASATAYVGFSAEL